MTTPENRVHDLGLQIPDYADPPFGHRYGRMKGFHRIGNLVEFAGLNPETRSGERLHPGIVGVDVSVAEATAAARLTAVQALGMIRLAVGSLDNVASLSRALCFITCPPGFEDLHLVSNGATELFLEVFGDEIGSVGRASIGATSLAKNNCFELWLSLEARDLTV